MRVDRPILITGCPRSGTSMTAGIIEKCGAFGGVTAPPNDNNKRGMYENLDIRNGLVKPYLSSIGADKFCQNPLPDIDVVMHSMEVRKDLVNKWRMKVFGVMLDHNYTQEGRWYYKDPKACLFWPLWAAAFPKADWVIVRRNTKDIVKSCLRTSFMRAFRHESGWLGWVDVHKERFLEMQQADLNVYYIWPQDWIDGDYSHIQRLIGELGLTWKEQEVREFVSPSLWKGQKGGDRS